MEAEIMEAGVKSKNPDKGYFKFRVPTTPEEIPIARERNRCDFLENIDTHVDLGSEIIHKFDSKVAVEFLRFNTYEGQRSADKNRIDVLKNKMLENKFRKIEIDIAIVPGGLYCNTKKADFSHLGRDFRSLNEKYGNQYWVLINGQHQLCSLILAEKIFRGIVNFYQCENTKQLACLYAQFDDNMRTDAQIANAYKGFLGEEWKPFSDIAIKNISSALWTNENQFQKRDKIDRETRFGYLKYDKYKEHALWAANLVYGSKDCPKWIQRSPIIACLIACHMANPQLAEERLHHLIDGANLDINSPEKALREWLIDPRKKTSQHIYLQFMKIWNAIRTGKKIDKVYHPDKRKIIEFK